MATGLRSSRDSRLPSGWIGTDIAAHGPRRSARSGPAPPHQWPRRAARPADRSRCRERPCGSRCALRQSEGWGADSERIGRRFHSALRRGRGCRNPDPYRVHRHGATSRDSMWLVADGRARAVRPDRRYSRLRLAVARVVAGALEVATARLRRLMGDNTVGGRVRSRALAQRYRGARIMIGILPIGRQIEGGPDLAAFSGASSPAARKLCAPQGSRHGESKCSCTGRSPYGT